MGNPVPRTGRRRYHSKKERSGKPNGVSGGSHVVSHRYADEGENGTAHRTEIRRKEGVAWRREWGV